MNHAELLTEIAASPEDATPYLVYADTLLSRGDPRGELVVLQHALETASVLETVELRRREAELFDAHLDEWRGTIYPYRDTLIVRWARGVLAGARLRLRETGDSLAPLRALLDAPLVTLTDLRLGPHKRAGTSCQPLLEMLVTRWPRGLQAFGINDGILDQLPELSPIDLAALEGVWLDTLTVHASDVALWNHPPRGLRRLVIRCPRFDVRAMAAVPCWPELEELTLFCEHPGSLRWLDPKRFPRLRCLGLTGTANTDNIVLQLIASPIFGQLEQLDLSSGTLGADGAALLFARRQIPRLDVRRNLIPSIACDLLVERYAAVVEPQRRGTGSLADPIAARATSSEIARNLVDAWTRSRLAGNDGPLAALYELGDPRAGDERHLALANQLPPSGARIVLSRLAASWRRDLSPHLRAHGSDLALQLAAAHDQLGDLHATEIALWDAVTHTRWYGWPDNADTVLDRIATIRLRTGDLAGAVPMRRRLAEIFERTHCAAIRPIIETSLLELAEGKLARAEITSRRAHWISRGTRDESRATDALAGLVWARADVESTARGAWLFAIHQVLLGPTAETDPALVEIACSMRGREHTRMDGLVNRSRAVLSRLDRGEQPALALLGELALARHDHARAMHWLRLAVDGAVTDHERGIALGIRGRLALDAGRYPDAREDFTSALACDRAAQHRLGEAVDLCWLADVYLVAMQYAEATVIASQAVSLLVADREYATCSRARVRLGRIAQLAGDRDLAEHHYLAAIEDAERDRHLPQPGALPLSRICELRAHAEIWFATLRAQEGQIREAYRLLERARSRLRRTSARAFEEIATCRAILGRFAGGPQPIPKPRCFETRLLSAVLR